jgi:16S rRNA (cytosine1402-N4)-methyltransferase
MAAEYHIPVLATETVDRLAWDPNGIYLDATTGGGGHAERLLDRLSEAGRLIGIDRDPEAISEATARLARFGSRYEPVEAPFWELKGILRSRGVAAVCGVLFDLGVSSHQIDTAQRGFSFQEDGPLDMRMGPDATRTAEDVVNGYDRDALVRIFRTYGEERASRRIAEAICRRRAEAPIRRTRELSRIVREAAGGSHPQKALARIYQAIRIEVNDELGRLEEALTSAIDVLSAGGRLAVLSYHSLEDRAVKQTFAEAARGCICPPDMPVCGCGRKPALKVLTRRGVKAGPEEVARNPRARSATLRVAERTQEPLEPAGPST